MVMLSLQHDLASEGRAASNIQQHPPLNESVGLSVIAPRRAHPALMMPTTFPSIIASVVFQTDIIHETQLAIYIAAVTRADHSRRGTGS